MYQAKYADGTIVIKGDKVRDFHGMWWTFESVTHPRKVNVSVKADPNGSDHYPNVQRREFYAPVFELGIWDTSTETWTFAHDNTKED